MAWLLPVLLVLTLWLASYPYRLFTNYVIARRTGFPAIITPFNPQSLPWMILGVKYRAKLERFMPGWLFGRANITLYGWEYFERYNAHERYGKNFIAVTCNKNELNIGEPELAVEVLKRTKEFTQSQIGSHVMRIFGENLITSNGEHWARQRKLIASNINERVSNTVWKASCGQAAEMMQAISSEMQLVTDSITEYLKTIAINVLGQAGYGVYKPWTAKNEDKPLPGYKLTYLKATRIGCDHIVEATFIPLRVLLSPFVPKILNEVGWAKTEFPIHTKAMLDKERAQPSKNVNIMSMLVQESDAEKRADGSGQAGLTEDEIMGNLFVFTAAGFDTTANTMGYCMVLMATYPEWQDWLIEELDLVLKNKPEELEYTDVFPKLQRCLSLIYETMRLFTPVLHVARESDAALPAPAVVSGGGKTYSIPPGIIVYVSSASMHRDQAVWGEDADSFRPSRWIETSDLSLSPLHEAVKTMPKGTFLAWSSGPRICPGSKMSQVEFVSVFATIFRKWRVELVRRDGESIEESRKRVEEVMKDSQSRLTLQMNRPREVKVKFVAR